MKIRVIYRGNVQGVGFRFTTANLAKNHPVDGYVKNLPDGTVEMAAWGDKSTLTDFHDSVSKTMFDFIRETTVDWSDTENPGFKGFQIER